MAKESIIIDTDPGIDDAVAIAICLFAKELDVKAICATNGNVALKYTLQNVLKLQKLLGTKVPVIKGASQPLINKPLSAASVHGLTGMEGYDFPEPDDSLVVEGIAAENFHRIVSESPTPVTLVAIGSLTDYALYLRQYPEDIEKIKRLVLMGGAMGRGNFGVLSEFNFAEDPEAAKIVFESGLDIYVAPLEVGFQARIKPEVSEKIKTFGKVGDMFYHLFKKYRGGSFNTGLKIYDALAAAILLKPDLFEFQRTHVEIETTAENTRGASLMDFRGYLNKPNNATIGVKVDADRFVDWFVDAIKTTSEGQK